MPGLRGGAARHHAQHGHALVQQRVHGDEPAPRPLAAELRVEPLDAAARRRGASAKVTSDGLGRGVARRQQVQARRPLQALLGQHRHQEALHLERRRHPLVTLRTRSGSLPEPGKQRLARELVLLEHAVDRLARGGDEVERAEPREVLPGSSRRRRPGSAAPPALCGLDAEERERRPDRAVEAERLVLLEHQVLDELAGRVLDLDAHLARADAVDLRGRHARAPRRSGRCARPAGRR